MIKNHSNQIRISLIIPSFNQGQFIEQSINSVLQQNYPNTELIIMDGGSTDNTLDIIKKYDKFIDYWQSQKDDGQSSAINNGFRRATGTFLTWLNTDDLLLPHTLQAVNELAQKFPDCRWITSNMVEIDKNGTILKLYKGECFNKFFASKSLFSTYGPSSFLHKDVFQKYGYLDENLHYVMDTEMWYRLIRNGLSFRRLKNYNWAFRLHEDAKTSAQKFGNDKHYKEFYRESREIEQKHNMFPPNRFIKTLFNFYKCLHPKILMRPFVNNRWSGKSIEQFISYLSSKSL